MPDEKSPLKKSQLEQAHLFKGDYIDRLTRWDGTRVAGVC